MSTWDHSYNVNTVCVDTIRSHLGIRSRALDLGIIPFRNFYFKLKKKIHSGLYSILSHFLAFVNFIPFRFPFFGQLNARYIVTQTGLLFSFNKRWNFITRIRNPRTGLERIPATSSSVVNGSEKNVNRYLSKPVQHLSKFNWHSSKLVQNLSKLARHLSKPVRHLSNIVWHLSKLVWLIKVCMFDISSEIVSNR